jgi:hypothetical protein
MAGRAGHLTIGAEARVEEKLLPESRGSRITCKPVRGISRQGWQAPDPKIAQRCEFIFIPSVSSKHRAGAEEQNKTSDYEESPKIWFDFHINTLVADLTDLIRAVISRNACMDMGSNR